MLAVLGFISVLVTPALLRGTARLRVDVAARELASVLYHARSQAVRDSTFVGLKFHLRGPQPSWGLYRDGDGDGLRSDDILDGTDPRIEPIRPLQHFGARVGFGFYPGPVPSDPGDPGRRLDRLDDPIRFNRSDIISFSAAGTSSSGTLYLTDGADWQLAVRLNGRRGYPRILTYDPEDDRWH